MRRMILWFGALAVALMGAAALQSLTVGAIDLSCTGGGVCKEVKDSSKLGELIGKVVAALFLVVGVLAVIMIIVSGIRYIASNGNPEQIKAAKNTLLYSIIGLAVALSAYAIVNFVISQI